MGGDRYDAIVVGAGPAGAAAALVMAKDNLSVALLERGKYPGANNMFGGSIYREPTELLIPQFWEKAPIETTVISEELWFLDQTSSVKIGFTDLKFGMVPQNKFNVFRSDFDSWFAGKAQEAGATLFTETVARDLIYEKQGLGKKKVGGVLLDGGAKLYADVVILAEGGSAFLTEKAGLRGKMEPSSFTLYAKEVISLPRGKIEDRFNLEQGEGAIIGMLGYPSSGTIGKGGIWVNRNSLSVLVGTYLNKIIDNGLNPYHLLTRFKQHPLIRRLIKGGKAEEYQAHTIPKGGFKNIPKLFDAGILVAGDAAMMISGRRGTDLAMLTGKYAGETVVQAKLKGDFSSNTLAAYETKVNNSFFMADLKKGKNTKKYYEQYPDADYLINRAANTIFHEIFKVDLTNEEEKIKKIINEIKSIQPFLKTAEDFYQGLKHWRGV